MPGDHSQRHIDTGRDPRAVWSDQVLFERPFLEGSQLELGLGGAVLVDEGAEIFRLQVRPDESALKARSEWLRTRDPPPPKRKLKNRMPVGSNHW